MARARRYMVVHPMEGGVAPKVGAGVVARGRALSIEPATGKEEEEGQKGRGRRR